MSKLHTHYDNLKVSRDAPVAVIKAAYKALAQQNHPDRCTDVNAPRRMQIINDAYAELSDPIKRAAHDKWIARNERAGAPASSQGTSSKPSDVEKLKIVYRAELQRIRKAYDVQVNVAKRANKFERKIGFIMGILISIPIYMAFSSIDDAINKAHAAQNPQHQEVNMRN